MRKLREVEPVTECWPAHHDVSEYWPGHAVGVQPTSAPGPVGTVWAWAGHTWLDGLAPPAPFELGSDGTWRWAGPASGYCLACRELVIAVRVGSTHRCVLCRLAIDHHVQGSAGGHAGAVENLVLAVELGEDDAGEAYASILDDAAAGVEEAAWRCADRANGHPCADCLNLASRLRVRAEAARRGAS